MIANAIQIREGKKEDLPAVLALIKELAEYEKAPHEVEVTLEEMEKHGFSENPVFSFFVAETPSGIVGIALYYIKYSTWKGPCIFLEDLIVTQTQRRKGIGALLFQKMIEKAKEMKAPRLEWQVLEWNQPAINFYKKYNATLDAEWLNGKLVYSQLQEFRTEQNL
ncbi:MAG: N-acetyltransferase family protein [Bacteroidia bacterium]